MTSLHGQRRLGDRLRRALDAHPRIDAVDVSVDVRHGVVSLTGVVGSFCERLEAVATALQVPGVRSVENEITVRPYGRRTLETTPGIDFVENPIPAP